MYVNLFIFIIIIFCLIFWAIEAYQLDLVTSISYLPFLNLYTNIVI